MKNLNALDDGGDFDKARSFTATSRSTATAPAQAQALQLHQHERLTPQDDKVYFLIEQNEILSCARAGAVAVLVLAHQENNAPDKQPLAALG